MEIDPNINPLSIITEIRKLCSEADVILESQAKYIADTVDTIADIRLSQLETETKSIQ